MYKHSILVIKLRGHAFSAYITNLANSQKSCPYSVCKSFSKNKRCDNAKIDLIDRIVWRNNTLVIEMCVLIIYGCLDNWTTKSSTVEVMSSCFNTNI